MSGNDYNYYYDYDDYDADYFPSSEESSEELDYFSDASVSSTSTGSIVLR